MKGKLLSVLFFLGFVAFSYAQSIKIELGNSVKQGAYYTFPELKVTLDPGSLVKRINIRYTNSTIELPALPSGWNHYSQSGDEELTNEDGTEASVIQEFLRKVKYTLNSGKKGGEVEIEICNFFVIPQSMELRAQSLGSCSYDRAKIGYKSTKTAFVGGVEKHGTSVAPEKVFLGDEIEYKIMAVNAANGFGPPEDPKPLPKPIPQPGLFAQAVQVATLIIEDKLPEGLELVSGSISDGGSLTGGTIKWELTNVPMGEDKTVTFKVRLKTPLEAGFHLNPIKNFAKVTTKWNDFEYGEVPVQKEFTSYTDTTYHQRVVCRVNFVIDPAAGGSFNGTGNEQVIDYNTTPAAGAAIITPSPSYIFKKWKHGDITSLKPGDAVTPAAEGPESNATWYEGVSVKGDVTFTAEMELQAFSITYDLNDQAPSPKGGVMPTATPPAVANPTTYITSDIPAGGLVLNPPTRLGYRFVGWQINSDDPNIGQFGVPGNSPVIPQGTKGNLTCKAEWLPVPYDIIYKEKGTGTVLPPVAGNPTTYNLETLPEAITKPAADKPNHAFVGWTGKFAPTPAKTVDIKLKEGETYTTGELIYEAEFMEIDYKIEYNLDDDKVTPGGTMPKAEAPASPNPPGYKVSDIPVAGLVLNPPTRTGYIFKNWIVTKKAGGALVSNESKIPQGTEGDLIATAKWEPKPYGIGYELHGGTAPATPNPVRYTIETLPETVGKAPTKAGHIFIGWKGIGSVGLSAQIAPDAKRSVIIPLKTGSAWTQDTMAYEAVWHQNIVADKVSCEPPLKLKGVPGGKSYKWEHIVSATEKKTVGESLEYDAKKSGIYALHTVYVDTTVVDTFKVKFAFEGAIKLENNKGIPAKVDRRQEFFVKLDTVGRTVGYAWSVSEGDTTHSVKGDSLYVVFKTPGEKKVSVEVTVTLPGGLICKQDVSMLINIYEKYHGFFVDQHVTGGREDGSSWENAYKRIEDALDKARPGDCVWVARGTYTPPKGKSYEMKYDSVQVYGGFGAWENYLNERVFMSNPTIIQPSENGSSVVKINGVGSDARWDGFIIERGNATQGGGIFNNNSSVTIANCIIRGNRAEQGGGIYNESGSPIIYNTEISGNTAQDGAGMYNNSASPRLTNVTISGNFASANGGGLYNDGSNPNVRNTILWGNRAAQGPNVSNSSSAPTYSFSIIESPRAGWDVSLGTDGGNNVNSSPLFRKNGFDSNGNMQKGDYRLFAKSAALDNGLNNYVYMEKTRDAHLPTLGQSVYHKGFPYDLYGLSRIIDSRVDIGAYEFAPDLVIPQVAREIEIPEVEGLIFQPKPGIHYVHTGKDFIFKVSEKKDATVLKAGEVKKRLIDRLEIKTGIKVRDKDGIKMVELSESSVEVTLIKVTEPIKLSVNPNKTTSTEEIASTKVWAEEGLVRVVLENTSEVRIYGFDGRLVVVKRLNAGETAIPLSEGFYVVRIGERSYKVVVK